jgi:gliding motility-associated-like protein
LVIDGITYWAAKLYYQFQGIMRNFLLLLTVAVVSTLCVNTTIAQYCVPPATNLYSTGCTDDDYIRSFSTTGGSSNITNNNTGCNNATTGYTFFNTQTHAGVQGTVVNFSLSSQNTDIWNDGFKIWVDWNGDGTFNNTDELVYSPTTLTAPGTTVTGSFNIPATATPGTTRLRVRCVFNTTTFDACSNHVFGEVEDYNFQVIASVACSGVPNAGTPSVTPSTVCLGDPVSLNSTGVSLFSGLQYQWEVSTTNATTGFTPIAGATSVSATTSQTVTSWYRLKVTCTNTNDVAYTTATQVTSPPVLGGNYTIDKTVTNPTLLFPNTSTFKSFNDAYNAIKCGINAAVVFNVAPGTGPYNEQLIMTSINGATAQRTVTFNGNGETITFSTPTTNERAVFKLKNGAKHIRLENLVINANTGTFGYGVQLLNNADSNIVRNCTINLSVTDNTQNYAGIVINGTDAGPIATGNVLCDDNQFLNNTINGGYYGVTLVATFSGGASGGNKFYGNTIQNFFATGMHIAGSYNTIIDSNFITRPTRADAHTDINGILFTTEKNTNSQVTRNRIYNPFGGVPASTSNFFGINFNNSDGSVGAENVVANNIVARINGNGPVHGISNTGSDYVYYLHNTISLDETLSTATGVTRGFSQQTAAAGLIFYNNLITVKRGGTGIKHAIYLGANLLQGQDYNNYFVNAAGGTSNLGFYQSDRSSLANWQTATSQEAASVSTDPVFTNINDIQLGYTPVSSAMNDKGTYLGLPATDIDIFNTVRSQTTPDIGAVEFTPPPCTVPAVNGTASVTPSPICPNNPVQLRLNVGLFGSGQTFQWQSSTTGAPGTFTTDVSSPMIVTDTTIMAPLTSMYYRVAATCGGSTTYSNVVQLVVNPALPGGTYTINKTQPTNWVWPATTGNFNSFAAAKTAMLVCGITGPVVFNVTAGTGPYNEQFVLPKVPGADAINTITFNGNNNTIAFPSNNTAERAVIKLNGADYVTFNNFTINSVGSTFGYGVQLINDADSNRFANCTILSSVASASSANYAAVVINADPSPADLKAIGSSKCDGNVFENNTIQGGTYGVVLVGAGNADPAQNNKFIGNTVREFLAGGIYVAGTSGTLLEGNTITRLTRTVLGSPVYAIHMAAAPNNNMLITRNRITKMFNASQANNSQFSGIYTENVTQTAGTELVISNNAIYDIQGSGIQYALYNAGSGGVHYYHNTVSLDNPANSSASTRGFFQTGNASNIQFRNNIVTIRRGGTSAAATKYGIYLETPGSGITSDYNDFFIAGAGANNHVGFFNGNQTTLAAWKAASGKDANSFNIDPIYTSIATGDLTPQIAPLDNAGTPLGIPVDIINTTRNATTPDIGAWEFTPPACAQPPVAGTASVTPSSGVCLDAAIVLNVTGHSPLGQITFQWQTSPTGAAGTWTNIGPLQYTPQFNTTTTTSTYFRAEVTCNGVSSYTAPVQVTLNNILLAGTYDIGAGATTYVPGTGMTTGNFATWQEAVNAMLCGIGGTIVFNVAPGVYNERISIPNIPGTSATSTVTFQSANGNAASAELTYSADAGNNYTLRLIDAKFFRFRRLSFTGTNINAGRVIELANNASNDSIVECIINAPVSASVANTTAGIYVNAAKGTNLVIKGNTISNGAHGIFFTGTSTTSLALPGHLIDSNFVSGSYSHGINVQYINRLRLTKNKVTINGTISAGSAGIYVSYADTAFRIIGNTVNISNNTASGFGMQIQNSRSPMRDSSIVSSNSIYTLAGNTNSISGLTINSSRGMNVVNNVIGINSAGPTTYGLHCDGNIDSINFYNNSANVTSASSNGFAGYFNQSGAGYFRIYNNIFANSGGAGRALFVSNPANFRGDYNMLYSNGPILVQTSTGATTLFPTLKSWYTTWPMDRWSISYPPAFVSNTDLRPNLANPDVWAMHGRGTQIIGNSYDFNGDVRPETLTTGVPDLGAYEFFPTALPTVLSATPATPAPNTTQTFYYGTDTVMKITWKAIAPPSVETRRFSGVVPSGLGVRPDSMYFYTKVDIPGGGAYDYDMQLSYIDPWQGSIPQQRQIGLGRTTPGNSWVVGFTSKVNTSAKVISQASINFLDRFTGLINPYAPPVTPDRDSSNRGKRFWVAYAINQLNGGGGQEMYLYLSAQEAANVRVKIYGTGYDVVYPVPANTVVVVPALPKAGPNNAFLNAAGLFDKGIEITSDVPIVAYAHCTGSASSGAVMLLPVGVWGYDYKTLGITQDYGAGSFSYFYAIADSNNTRIEVTPSVAVQNPGFTANTTTTVTLNKGQVLQIVASSQTTELTGSTVRSVANSDGKCFPIAVFSGSSRTAIDVGQCGSGGDFIMQQNFPSTAWGKKYLTAPTSLSTSANTFANNIFRVAVKDPATVVRRNGVVLTPLINNHYYQFTTSTADYIEADKPIMVAQFEGGACADGDPEMFYISPMEQGIDKVSFYRNDEQNIDVNYLTLIIPTAGLPTLEIRDAGVLVLPDVVIPHPQNALTGGNYSVVIKRWATAAKSQVSVQSDYSFTAITYGQGSVESYGYNAGTLVKNLDAGGKVENVGATSPPDYNCAGTPFTFLSDFPLLPTSVTFKLSAVPGLAPAQDTTINNPVPSSVGTYPNGDPQYVVKLNKSYTITTLGIIPIPIEWTHPDIEGCDHKAFDTIYVQVLPTPRTDFSISNPVCEGNTVSFGAQNFTSNGVSVNQWEWTFHTGATATGQNATFTYPTAGTYNVNLHSVSPDGCIGDSVKQVIVNPLPSVGVVTDSIAVCPGSSATFNISTPLAGATYKWYDAATGGNEITAGANVAIGANGTSITFNNVSASADYWVEGISSIGCVSAARQQIKVRFLPVLPQTVVSYTGGTANTVSFSWTAVPGAVSYDVSTNGTTWSTPSSGATGLTHTVTGVGTLQSVSLYVRVNGALSCQASISLPQSGCSVSPASVVNATVSVCTGTSAVFNIQNPVAGITYNWYDALTGGTLLGSGSTFNSPVVSGTANFYVEQVSGTCVGAPRTMVTANILPPLAPAVITNPVADADRTVNSVTFRWSAVAGAGSYQVSVDGGAYITPSSGSTGLSHTVTGLTPLKQACIKVRAIGTIACQTSESVQVCATTRPDEIFIPNTFTPNGDNKNDVLSAYGFAIQSIQFMVFNQWGEKIYEVTNSSMNAQTGEFRLWDGKYQGKVQPVGVYVYAAKITLKDGTVINRSGALNIVR